MDEDVKTRSIDSSVVMMQTAKIYVLNYYHDHLDPTERESKELSLKDVYVVWFCKTLQHFKVLLSTTVPDGMYYEVTYNGDKDETYLDAYKRFGHETYNEYEVNSREAYVRRIDEITRELIAFDNPEEREKFISEVKELTDKFLSKKNSDTKRPPLRERIGGSDEDPEFADIEEPAEIDCDSHY